MNISDTGCRPEKVKSRKHPPYTQVKWYDDQKADEKANEKKPDGKSGSKDITPEEREEIIASLREGRTLQQVGFKHGRHFSTISKIRKQAKEDGVL